MGMSADSDIMLTTGGIPALLKCHFVVKAAELSGKGLLALVQTFVTGPICQTACMVIVKERDQPPIQPCHDESYCHKPVFGIGTTYNIPSSTIQGAVNHLPLIPLPDNSQWYVSNTIDLNRSN
jgi:hypothetical protein